MKTLLTITTALLLSTAVQAEDESIIQKSVDAAKSVISTEVETNEIVNADLLKSLDVDEDGAISKEEAVDSKEITSAWDSLDTNKDEKLDQEEFALFSSVKE